MADQVEYYGTGRRKSAVARVFLRPGNGDVKVNGKPFNDHFVTVAQRIDAMQPLAAVEMANNFNVIVSVDGGGVNGQAGAVKMGIARALILFNPELRAKLKSSGFLRRDPRGKERKKYGQKGARKRFQFSKR
jgi:small subunit ribosomal protein S9